MDTGKLLAREYFNPEMGPAVRLPTPALRGCSPMQADRRSIRSVFWYSETDILPAHLTRELRRCCLCVVPAHDGPPPLGLSRGEDVQSQHEPERLENVQECVTEYGGVFLPESGGVLTASRSKG